MSDNTFSTRDYRGDLTKGPIKGHLIRLTIPMIWGLFAVIAVQLADTYFISLLGDTTILAGISFTFPVTMAISHLVFGFNIALASVVSRLIGEKKYDDVRRVVLHGVFTGFLVTALICGITYLHLELLFTAMGADEQTFPVVMEYMPIWLVACSVLAFPTKSNSAIRSAGDTATPAIVMSVIALVNLILDPLLIFGLWGFPEMGVKGAALATLVSFICGAVMALYIVAFRKKMMATDGLHLDHYKDSMKRLLVIAIPAGIANVIAPLSTAIVTALLAVHGAEAVAAFGVVSRVEALAFLLVIALAVSMAPIIGQNWGAKNYERVHETIRLAIVFNLIWSAFVAVVLAVLAKPIASAFSADVRVIEYTALFFWVLPFSYGIGNLVFGWSSAFNAMGMPQKAFVMIVVKMLVITVPAAYIGGHLYGVIGIIGGVAVANVVSGLLFHFLSKGSCVQKEAALQDA